METEADFLAPAWLFARLGVAWLLASAVMAVLWRIGVRLRNHGVVDVGWTGLVTAIGMTAAVFGAGSGARRLAVGLMVGAWGARLGSYLLFDRLIGRPEDRRYTELRRRWGAAAEGRFWWFYQAQAAAAVVFAAPALLASSNPARGFAPIEWAGVLIWTLGVAGETIADAQLVRFKAAPAHHGRTCRAGLWRYSRHPNYFFEWLVWVGLAVFAAGSPLGMAAFLCPLIMLVLLFRVTGIPATEAQAIRSRGDEYRAYQESTSVFVPWPPRDRPGGGPRSGTPAPEGRAS